MADHAGGPTPFSLNKRLLQCEGNEFAASICAVGRYGGYDVLFASVHVRHGGSGLISRRRAQLGK